MADDAVMFEMCWPGDPPQLLIGAAPDLDVARRVVADDISDVGDMFRRQEPDCRVLAQFRSVEAASREAQRVVSYLHPRLRADGPRAPVFRGDTETAPAVRGDTATAATAAPAAAPTPSSCHLCDLPFVGAGSRCDPCGRTVGRIAYWARHSGKEWRPEGMGNSEFATRLLTVLIADGIDPVDVSAPYGPLVERAIEADPSLDARRWDTETETTPTREPETETTPTREPKTETTPTREPKTETTPTREPKTETTPTREPKTETTPTREPKTETTPTRGGCHLCDLPFDGPGNRCDPCGRTVGRIAYWARHSGKEWRPEGMGNSEFATRLLTVLIADGIDAADVSAPYGPLVERAIETDPSLDSRG